MKNYQEEERAKNGKEIYLGSISYSETARTIKTEARTPMKVLGRVPSSLENYPIITRKECELFVQFFEERFQE